MVLLNATANLISSSFVNSSVWKVSYVPTQSLSFGTVTVNATTWKFKGLNATLNIHSNVEYYSTERDINTDMKFYLPNYYNGIPQIDTLLNSESLEFTRLNAIIRDVLHQFQIEKSTWGLTNWENNSKIDGNGLPLEQRKQRVKNLLEMKTYSISRHKEIIGHECDISEDVDQFIVKTVITGVRGEPNNISEIKFNIDKVTPAHTTNEIMYSYLPWHEIEDADYQWDNVSEYKIGSLETTFLK